MVKWVSAEICIGEKTMNYGLMPSRIFQFMIIALIIALFLAPKAFAQQDNGYLHVTSKPDSGTIYIDSEFTNSRTPTTRLINLEPGDYRLGVAKNGYKLYEDKIAIKSGKVLEMEIILSEVQSEETSMATSELYVESYLTVRSEPPGADVVLNDENIGVTPVKDYKIKPGEPEDKHIKITKADYDAYEETISWPTIKNGIKAHVSAKLEPTKSVTKAKPKTSPKDKASPKEKSGKEGFAITRQTIAFVVALIIVVAILVVRIVIRRRSE